MKLSGSFSSHSASPMPSAARMRQTVSVRNVESAPCFVREPTSSLSNTAQIMSFSAFSAARNDTAAENAHCKSSSRGARINSPCAPAAVPFWRG